MNDVCKCGHQRDLHHHDRSCTGLADLGKLKFCKCEEFRAVNQIQIEGEEMAKKKKSASRTASSLLYFINKEKVKAFDNGRLLDKKNDSYTCAIAQTLFAAGNDGLEFEALVKAVSKIVKHKNEKTLRLSTRWYLSSKRSDVAKFVTSKREEADDSSKREKKVRSTANGAAKPRKRKARTAAKKETKESAAYEEQGLEASA